MDYRRFGEKVYIRLDKGDEVMSSLAAVCEREDIALAQIHGIGGCSKAVVGVFDPDKKDYDREEVSGMLEMISLDGNITAADEKPFVHAHATFAYHDKNGNAAVLCGHLLEAVIGLTGEIVLTPADGSITRRYDDILGIRTWDFS